MSRSAWVLFDPVSFESYVLPTNPSEDSGSFAVGKPVVYSAVAASYQSLAGDDSVGTLVFGGPTEQQKFSFTGNVYTVTEYDALVGWVGRGHPVELTDDLGRTYSVYSESFETSRVRSRRFPFKFSYTWNGIVLGRIY